MTPLNSEEPSNARSLRLVGTGSSMSAMSCVRLATQASSPRADSASLPPTAAKPRSRPATSSSSIPAMTRGRSEASHACSSTSGSASMERSSTDSTATARPRAAGAPAAHLPRSGTDTWAMRCSATVLRGPAAVTSVDPVDGATSWAGDAKVTGRANDATAAERIQALCRACRRAQARRIPGKRRLVADGFEILYDPDGLLWRCTSSDSQPKQPPHWAGSSPTFAPTAPADGPCRPRHRLDSP